MNANCSKFKNILLLVLLFFSFFSLKSFADNKINNYQDEQLKDAIEQAYALYATKNFKESKEILLSLDKNKLNEENYLILGNIYQENNDLNSAVKYYNKALGINNEYYKAYYNLGYIFATRKSYHLAINNFELALKYKKDFAPCYYNLAFSQMALKNYSEAKKNLLKALQYENDNKYYYYNLIYCYKELNKTKEAGKLLKVYEQKFS